MIDTDPTEDLPLRRTSLLSTAVGRRLIEIERVLTPLTDHLAFGGVSLDYFARASGPAVLTFSGQLVHTLVSWPSQLSVLVLTQALTDDPYAESHLLSTSGDRAPSWLFNSLGARVLDVRVHVFEDTVPSDEARQAAVSYVLDNNVELFYCTQLHGRMTADELIRREDLPDDLPARTISLSPASEGSA